MAREGRRTMSGPRRSKPLAPAVTPLIPESSSKPDNQTDIQWWRRLLSLERKRHGQVETILTRTITNLEQQVSDLRGLYFERIAPKPSDKGKQ
jgi:hypothetical protein